ncbi:TetR/AcrR family transcriptional regulator [Tabrizicola sp.]|jgi:AcrR family transcriptional regulator|uniref:TetR/AcrR family transcriptional regulator n=1 Tax=Tabrizicola sp. TaxID=2005166 RepID=UPI003D2CB9F6
MPAAQLSLKSEAKPDSRPDSRTAEILARVRVAFAEKGFDGASMQDLARTAGISVGNFYRYFPSKSAIVEALIALDLAEMEADFHTVLQSPTPMDSLRALMQQRLIDHRTRADGQLWAEITAAALRKPDICQAACAMETQIATYLNRVFAAETGLSEAEITARFPAHAAFAITMFKTATMLPPSADPIREDLTALIQRAIDATMSEILAARKA